VFVVACGRNVCRAGIISIVFGDGIIEFVAVTGSACVFVGGEGNSKCV